MGTRPFSTTRHDTDGRDAPAGSSPSVRNSVPGRIREAAALLLFALGAFLALSLLSYKADPHDPSLTGRDWAGPVGAGLAALLVRGFGIVAWLAPVDLALLGAPLFRGRPLGPIGLRLAGDLLVGIIVAALVQVAMPSLTVFGAMRGGGNVGLLFGELMRAMFSTLGSFLVGGTAVGLILIGRSSFSFIAGCERALQIARALVMRLVALGARLLSAWRERWQAWRSAQASDQSLEAVESATDTEEEDVPAGAEVPPEADDCEQSSVGELTAATPFPPTASVVEACENAHEEQSEADGGAVPESRDRSGPASKLAGEPKIVDTKPQQRVTRSTEGFSSRSRARGNFELPNTDLLGTQAEDVPTVDKERVLEHARLLEKTLSDYGVQGTVEEIHPGPTVTTYEVAPQAGTKVSKVANLSDDLALGLSRKVRIIAPIPGKSRIGFELPNDERIPVNLRELVEDKRFAKLASRAPLPVVLGRDIVGAPFYADLASMPHVIVAGATGAGKSVGLNVMLSSLLFWRNPDELRLLMIDPKVVELAPFDGIPHMLLPVVTDMKQAAVALRWAVDEMERRYQLFATAGTKNILTYNQWAERVQRGDAAPPATSDVEAMGADGAIVSVPTAKEGTDGALLPGKLPHIVIVVDEFADLMMQQGKEVEASVARLAQKARAAGMHVLLATQRPSVDVITGMIKANFPSRIAFRVAQKVDSRTILDEQGAEVLLGKGDMLVKLNGASDTRRVQCPFISEEEVAQLTDYLRTQGAPQYHEAILEAADDDGSALDPEDAKIDSRFDEAVQIVADTQRCSTSWLQRKMTIGYNRAAKIVEMMEKKGMVGPANGAKDREVYLHSQ